MAVGGGEPSRRGRANRRKRRGLLRQGGGGALVRMGGRRRRCGGRKREPAAAAPPQPLPPAAPPPHWPRPKCQCVFCLEWCSGVRICVRLYYLFGCGYEKRQHLGGTGAEGRGGVKFLMCKTLSGVQMCCARPGCMWGVKGGSRLESVDWRRCRTQNKVKARGAAAQGRACTYTAAAAAARLCCCRGAGDDCWWARVPAALRGGVQHKHGAFVFFVPAEGGESE